MNEANGANYEIREDAQTLHDRRVGESMHSAIGAWPEANLIYVGQSGLRARVIPAPSAAPDPGPVVVYDLGLGIGANALATLAAYRQCPAPRRALRIESFESDLSGISFALASGGGRFPFLRDETQMLGDLLRAGRWRSPAGDVEWNVHEGDFLAQDLSRLPLADVIYFDFFSPRATPRLWGVESFAKLRARGPAGRLITYSAATRVRAALLLAGWYVGEGCATALKSQTTIAEAASPMPLRRPLGPAWRAHWARSGSRVPEGCGLDPEALAAAIAGVPQWIDRRDVRS